jgi:hypothetical protein
MAIKSQNIDDFQKIYFTHNYLQIKLRKFFLYNKEVITYSKIKCITKANFIFILKLKEKLLYRYLILEIRIIRFHVFKFLIYIEFPVFRF